MLSLTKKLDDEITLSDGSTYKLHLGYRTVLKWYEMLEDDNISDTDKVNNSFLLFVGDVPNVSLNEQAKVVNAVQEMITERPYGNQEFKEGRPTAPKRFFSYTKDAEAIYASFIYDYGIDLTKCPGMRWEKFQALFSNLSSDSPFMRIVQIRQRDTTKLEGDELSNVSEAQQYYALDEKDTAKNVEADMQNVFSMLQQNSVKKGG